MTRTVKRETLNMFNRDSLVNTARERAVPSGGAYPDCVDAADEECCLALHQVSYDQDSAADIESGCAARCLLERRTGFEHACLPGHDECMDDGAANGVAWAQSRFVKVMCFCGGRFSIDPADNQEELKKDGEECEEDAECEGASICFNGKCRPPGIECDACNREVDCDVGNSRAFGVFKCAYGQCIYDAQNQAPDGHACLNNIDCQSNDCATFAGDTGTNLLTRYCRSQANGICGAVNTATFDQLGHPIIGFDVAHTGYHCWGDKMGGTTIECADTLCTECDAATGLCATGFPFGSTCADGCACASGICHPAFAQCTHEQGTFRGADGDACTAADQCQSNLCGTCFDPAGSRCYSLSNPLDACADNCECSSGICFTNVCTFPDASFAGPNDSPCTSPTQCQGGACEICGIATSWCLTLSEGGGSCSDNCQCANGCETIQQRCLYSTGAPDGAVCDDNRQCGSGRCNVLQGINAAGIASGLVGICEPSADRCEACVNNDDCGNGLKCAFFPGQALGTCIRESGALGGESCNNDGMCASGKCSDWFGANENRYCASANTGDACGGGSQDVHCFGYAGDQGSGCANGPCIAGTCLEQANCRVNCNTGTCPAGYTCTFNAGEPNMCIYSAGAAGGNSCFANAQCASGVCVDWLGAGKNRFCSPNEGEPCQYDASLGSGRHVHCFGTQVAGEIVLGSDCSPAAPFCVTTPEPHSSGTPALGVCSATTTGRRLQSGAESPTASEVAAQRAYIAQVKAAMSEDEWNYGYFKKRIVNDTLNYEVIPKANNTAYWETYDKHHAAGLTFSFTPILSPHPPSPPPSPGAVPPPPSPSPPPPAQPPRCESIMRDRTNTQTIAGYQYCFNLRVDQYDCDKYFHMDSSKKMRACKYSADPKAYYCHYDPNPTNCEFLPPAPPPSPPPPHPPPTQCQAMQTRTSTAGLNVTEYGVDTNLYDQVFCFHLDRSTHNCDDYYSINQGNNRMRTCYDSGSGTYCSASDYVICDFLPPSPPPPGSNLERRRKLDRIVDPLMGDHLTAGDDCRSDLMEFKLRFFRLTSAGGTACDYDAVDAYTAITGATFPTCDPTVTTAAAYDNCCITDRHADHRSMYFLSNDNTGQNFANGVPIGDNVYGGKSTAMISADLNGDGFEELLMANGIFFNTAGTFTPTPNLVFTGITAWKRLYVADMDAHNTYPDIVGLDVNGRAYIMRSSVAATPMATSFEVRFDTSVRTGLPAEKGNFMVECVLQDPACTASTACPSVCYAPFYYNTQTEFDVYLKPDAYPIWQVGDRLRATTVVAADLAGSTCDGNKFLNYDLEIVRIEHFDMDTVRRDVATEQADATWAATTAHHPTLRTHHRMRLRFVDKTVCTAWPAWGAGYWLPAITTMTLTGTPKIHSAQTRPAPGQIPTFYPPQRIGGVDDFGAVDIAAIDALSHTGERDTQKDICLLFRGRPVKCYLLPELPVGSSGQLVYDASNVKDVVYPGKSVHQSRSNTLSIVLVLTCLFALISQILLTTCMMPLDLHA